MEIFEVGAGRTREVDLTPVSVRVEVAVGQTREVFELISAASGDPFDAAEGALAAVNASAGRWIRLNGMQSRGGRV